MNIATFTKYNYSLKNNGMDWSKKVRSMVVMRRKIGVKACFVYQGLKPMNFQKDSLFFESPCRRIAAFIVVNNCLIKISCIIMHNNSTISNQSWFKCHEIVK